MTIHASPPDGAKKNGKPTTESYPTTESPPSAAHEIIDVLRRDGPRSLAWLALTLGQPEPEIASILADAVQGGILAVDDGVYRMGGPQSAFRRCPADDDDRLPTGLVTDRAEVLRAITLLGDPRGCVTMVTLPLAAAATVVGHRPDIAVRLAERLPITGTGDGLYLGIHPVRDDLGGCRASAADVTRRRWIAADIDTIRPDGVPATEPERQCAADVVDAVYRDGIAAGWPDPIVLDSGNGYWVLYPCDLPNDEVTAQAVRRYLQVMAGRHGTAGAQIDTCVSDAPRIMRLPGGENRKGTPSADRPHRTARLVSVPADPRGRMVTMDMLIAVAGPEPERSPPPPPPPPTAPPPPTDPFRQRATDSSRHRDDAYARAAMDEECQRVASAAPGGRNNALNRAAFALGQLVAGGMLTESEVRQRLTDAALAAGLEPAEIGKTITSGLTAGMREPRTRPDDGQAAGATTGPGATSASPPPPGNGQSAGAAGNPLPRVRYADVAADLTGDYIIKGLLPRTGMAVIYGDSGSGKTFLALDMALRVAAGGPWRGRRVRGGAVLYIAAEAGRSANRRVVAFREATGLADLPLDVVPCAVDLRSPAADVQRVIDAARASAEELGLPVVMIVIDTLARAFGGGNENSSEDMGSYIRNLDRIRDAMGCLTVTVHHSGKDAARGARGHSSLRAATDVEIEVTADRASGIRTATASKVRDGEDGTAYRFRLRPVELGVDMDGDPVTSCVVVDVADDDQPERDPRADMTTDQRRAWNVLAQLCERDGEVRHGCPHGQRVVTLGQWREGYYAVRPDVSADARRQGFHRASTFLLGAKLAYHVEPYVWPADLHADPA